MSANIETDGNSNQSQNASAGADASTRQREKEIKAHLVDYFSEAQDARLAEFRMREHSKLIIKSLMFLCGLGLVFVPIVKTAMTEAVDWQQMFAEEGLRFILPGIALVFIAFVPTFWTNSWYRPLALALLLAALTFNYLELGNFGTIAALGGIALIMLFWDVWDWWIGRKDPKELAAVESEIDAWIKERFEGLLGKAQPDIPVPQDRLQSVFVLKTFPKADRIERANTFARIGTDKKPRISPVGLVAFDFGETDVVLFEGAVDLIANTVVYARIHEFRYEDIVSLSWSSDVSPPADIDDPKPSTPLKLASGAKLMTKREVPRVVRRDEFQIRLRDGNPLSIVFRDSTIHTHLANAAFKPIEELSETRKVWEYLSACKRRVTDAVHGKAG